MLEGWGGEDPRAGHGPTRTIQVRTNFDMEWSEKSKRSKLRFGAGRGGSENAGSGPLFHDGATEEGAGTAATAGGGSPTAGQVLVLVLVLRAWAEGRHACSRHNSCGDSNEGGNAAPTCRASDGVRGAANTRRTA